MHMEIEYIMIAGHTKFAPDQHISIWKNKFTYMDVEILRVVMPYLTFWYNFARILVCKRS